MKRTRLVVPVMLAVLAIGTGVALYTGLATADEQGHHASSGAPVAQAPAGDPYPLTTCPVSEAELGSMGEPIIYDHNGREIRFCCNGCISKFEADPEKYLKVVDEQIIAQQKPFYPLSTCLVTGEKLGGMMGEPIDVVYSNRLVRFCCKGCIKDFNTDPVAYMAQLDAAVIASQVKDYPLATCVVTGEKLGGSMGEPIDYVFANRLVRFCCKGCIKEFEADPAKFMSKLN